MRALYLFAFCMSGVLLATADVAADPRQPEVTPAVSTVDPQTGQALLGGRLSVEEEQEERQSVLQRLIPKVLFRVKPIQVQFASRRAIQEKISTTREGMSQGTLGGLIIKTANFIDRHGRRFRKLRKLLKKVVALYIARLHADSSTSSFLAGKQLVDTEGRINNLELLWGKKNFALMISQAMTSGEYGKEAKAMEEEQFSFWFKRKREPKEMKVMFTVPKRSTFGGTDEVKRVLRRYRRYHRRRQSKEAKLELQ